MSTADSQLLVAASSISHDLKDARGSTGADLKRARWVALIIGLLAIASPDRIFNRVLFAWQALAVAFGPLLVITLWRGPVRPAWRIATVATGFTLTVLLSSTVDSPVDWVERLVPLAIALLLSWLGSGKK